MTKEEYENSLKTMYFKNDEERDKAYKKVKKILDEANCCDVGYKMLLGKSNSVYKQNSYDEKVSALIENPKLVKRFDVTTEYGAGVLSSFIITD